MILRSRFVVPVEAPPIDNGAVSIRDGRIVQVGRACDVSGGRVFDLGDAALCPGFVNAHTHLELTDLQDRIKPRSDFTQWLKDLVVLRQTDPPTHQTVSSAVCRGALLSADVGVVAVGDIASHPSWVRSALEQTELCGVSFGEVIAAGRMRDRLDARIGQALTLPVSKRWRSGISPHAPYTLEPEGMRACAERAESARSPICIHLAETEAEEEFTRSGTGPLAHFLREQRVWEGKIPAAGCGPVELADRCKLLTPRTVIAHANYVSDADIERILRSGASVAYCPRTHHAFGHAPHRFREMLACGVHVCLGTDSLASNPSLSILDELRFLKKCFSDLSPEVLLKMGTLHGAQALGLDRKYGSIAAGMSADLAYVPLGSAEASRGWESMFNSTGKPGLIKTHCEAAIDMNPPE